jgi:hypothetical protein
MAKWIKTAPKTPVSILKELILQYELGPALAASARAWSMKTLQRTMIGIYNLLAFSINLT